MSQQIIDPRVLVASPFWGSLWHQPLRDLLWCDWDEWEWYKVFFFFFLWDRLVWLITVQYFSQVLQDLWRFRCQYQEHFGLYSDFVQFSHKKNLERDFLIKILVKPSTANISIFFTKLVTLILLQLFISFLLDKETKALVHPEKSNVKYLYQRFQKIGKYLVTFQKKTETLQ